MVLLSTTQCYWNYVWDLWSPSRSTLQSRTCGNVFDSTRFFLKILTCGNVFDSTRFFLKTLTLQLVPCGRTSAPKVFSKKKSGKLLTFWKSRCSIVSLVVLMSWSPILDFFLTACTAAPFGSELQPWSIELLSLFHVDFAKDSFLSKKNSARRKLQVNGFQVERIRTRYKWNVFTSKRKYFGINATITNKKAN